MKRVTLVKQEVVDGKKVFVGKQDNFPIPETIDEVLGMVDLDDGCNEAEIVSCFNYGWRVKSQAKLANAKTADPLIKAVKDLTPEQKAKVEAEIARIKASA